MRVGVWAWLLIAGCGRYDFASVPGLRGDAGFANDGVVVGGGTANRAFVTSGTFDGNLGGQAGADMKCQTAATAVGLQGTFIAFISTSTSDAISRLSGSRGWLRMDGAPIADQPDQIVSLALWNPIDLDEHGTPVALTAQPWTGSTIQGTRSATMPTCSDWTANTPNSASGAAGFVQAAWPGAIWDGNPECRFGQPLYCFEIGHVAQVTSGGIAGRIAFLSRGAYAGGGVAALDTMCANEAAAAHLTGTFVAGVATSSASIATRAGSDSRAWRRVDGVELAVGNAFFDGTALQSFLTQYADGTYVLPTDAFTGGLDAVTPGTGTDCSDWSDTSATGMAEVGSPGLVSSSGFWSSFDSASDPCNFGAGVICLQR